MQHHFRRARLSRVAVLVCATFALLTPGESLYAAPASRVVAPAPLAPQASSRSRAKTQSKRTTRRRTPVRRASRRSTPVASTAWTSPHGAAALATDLAGMISTKVRSGQFGAMVTSLTRGDTLFARNASEMMQPASTMKLFSTAVALDRYGPEHSFSTDVLRDSPVGPDGMVDGSIYLRSDGDPSMSARFYRDPNLPMATLARAVAAAGG